ncbi:MAG TPA: polymer-forming cytoskeletal protein [Treponemataceae bacterium]|jgi:cytoskeletal protein CcmA (bactofilin family)|nr:polymer-forming cytoskeletal protein [Treponemataceae bacterium]
MARFTEKEKEKNVTIFGAETRFNGVLRFTEELHIAGRFEGTIDAQGALVIKKGAACDVDYVKAASIVVEGSVQGNLKAGDRIEMKAGSSVRGDVAAQRLRIADGVSFEGSVEMIRAPAPVDLFSTRSDVLKSQLQGGH